MILHALRWTSIVLCAYFLLVPGLYTAYRALNYPATSPKGLLSCGLLVTVVHALILLTLVLT